MKPSEQYSTISETGVSLKKYGSSAIAELARASG